MLVVKCPKCGNSELKAINEVISYNYIAEWARNKHGELEPVYSGNSDVIWDSSLPRNPDYPFYCGTCYTELALKDLHVEGEESQQPPLSIEYRVVWKIDINAGSPHAAAVQAQKIMLDPSSIALVFDVESPAGNTTRVDLWESKH